MSGAIKPSVPGITLGVDPYIGYDWAALGKILAGETDRGQADFLDAFAAGLAELALSASAMQLLYVADWLKLGARDEEDPYDLEAVKWVLRDLLGFLEGDE